MSLRALLYRRPAEPTSISVVFEREVYLEYYFPPNLYPTNQSPLRSDIGLRLSSSSYSRPRLKLTNPETSSPWPNSSVQKPSFNLFFNGDFGPGKLDYSLDMARQLRLTASDFFMPGVDGQKAVQRRWKS